MAVFTYIPDQGATREVKARVEKTPFGDGYAQSLAEGANNLVETWKISFTLKRRGEIQAIDNFLKQHLGATKFTWTTPHGDTLEFVCESWSTSYNHEYDNSLSATFEQRY